MLEVLVRIFSGILMISTGYYIISNIELNRTEKLNQKNFFLLILLFLFSIYNFNEEYTAFYTLSVIILNIIIYKFIFKLSIENTICSVIVFMITLFISDIIVTSLFKMFFNVEEIRNNEILFLITNIFISIICIVGFKIQRIRRRLLQVYDVVLQRKRIINSAFLIILILDFCVVANNIIRYEIYRTEYLSTLIGVVLFCVLSFFYFKNEQQYNQLSIEYENLFCYVQTFEDWIEKEQFNRHEYKNQLAVIRCITKDKKVKNKIDEILEDNINIDEQSLTNLKSLPKGGLKGLMYYKSALAQKQKIKLSTDVYINEKGILSKLSKEQTKVLCKLIGIYFDNAIEAAMESKKKIVVVEIYELKDRVSIVFSNTFKKGQLLKDRNKKGVSSKGEGRGNGLYFASKLLKNNKWLKEHQDNIDGYYIEQITIAR